MIVLWKLAKPVTKRESLRSPSFFVSPRQKKSTTNGCFFAVYITSFPSRLAMECHPYSIEGKASLNASSE